MDKLIVRNLGLFARVGVTAAEREVGQRLAVSVEALYDLRPAGQSDLLEDTVSYAELARTVYEVGTTLECQLLEHMAEAMAAALLAAFPITEVRLQLLKVPPPASWIIEAAGVEITRRVE